MAEPNKKKKIKGFKEFDPKKYIETKPVLDEAKMGDSVVVSFGRMNPITTGHEKLAMSVIREASKRKAVPMIFLSHSQDKKKNPLSYEDKIRFATTAFGPAVKNSNFKTVIEIAKSLSGKYKNFIFVCGSDRVPEFDRLLKAYNGKDYTFENIEIVSAGARDPDAEGVAGISGTKMREFAANNDIKNFTQNLPKKLKSKGQEVMDAVREGMGLSEQVELELDEALNRMQRRKRAIAMKRARFKVARGREKAKRRTASIAVLKKRARKAAINLFKKKFAKGRDYKELSSAEKEIIDKRIEKISKKRIETIAKKLMPKVKEMERERRKAMFSPKTESVNEASCTDTKVRKKPHMLLNKEGKVKFDGRFKLYKKKVNESYEDLSEELTDLIEATEQFNEGEKKGLWDNIHAKRKRIKAGSGEKMRKPGSKGAPTDADFKNASESTDLKQAFIDSMQSKLKKRSSLRDPNAKTAREEDKLAKQLAAKQKMKEEVELDEALDPSEIASNPKMYDAATVKKAYYHKSVSAQDKQYLERHLDRHHGNRNWRKPVKEEVELDEGKFDKYITKSTPTTPGIKKVSNPAGRSGDHIEWEVTGKTSADKRTFNTKKAAMEYLSLFTKESVELDEGKMDKDHPIVKEYNAMKKHDIKTLRGMIKGQQRIVDTSEYRSKDHAISAYLRHKHGDKRVDQAFGFKEEVELEEAIKGWKHAHSDIMKSRANSSKSVHLHLLKKDGKESGMNDARKSFSSEKEAEAHHKRVHELNPGKKYKHNMYVDGKLVKTLGESASLEEAKFKVKVSSLPPVYVDSKSASDVKRDMRKLVKPEHLDDIDIERVQPSEIKKDFRARVAAKDATHVEESTDNEKKKYKIGVLLNKERKAEK